MYEVNVKGSTLHGLLYWTLALIIIVLSYLFDGMDPGMTGNFDTNHIFVYTDGFVAVGL